MAKQHPEPEPRPTVGGSFTLDQPTGKWLPTHSEAPPPAPAFEPIVIDPDNG